MKGKNVKELANLPKVGSPVLVKSYDTGRIYKGIVRRIRSTRKIVIDTKEEGILGADFKRDDDVWGYEEEEEQ